VEGVVVFCKQRVVGLAIRRRRARAAIGPLGLRRSKRLALLAMAIGWTIARPGLAADERVDFNRHVRPILSQNCFACHGRDEKKRQAELRLDLREIATADRDGTRAVAPGHPEASELIHRIAGADPGQRMPPPASGKKLTGREIEVLRRWIAQGAPYAPHWAYLKPVRPALPAISDRAWPKNAVDHFVLARLEREGLRPSAEADREALVRRVSLGVTGLPPTREEAGRFLADRSPDAYEKLVDRLLSAKAYGEHWARMWLDLARYADSAGYVADRPREIWAFRDYCIRAFNANKPFDRFTIEQIAGDLLPGAGDEQLIATAFHRNTQTNDEGGTDDEEFRNVAVVDRVNTTMSVWMGTTMACAQCHDHKYDPLSQKEYFQFFAFFNNTEDADIPDERPVYSFFTEEQKRERSEVESQIAALENKLRAPGETGAGADHAGAGPELRRAHRAKTDDRGAPVPASPGPVKTPAKGVSAGQAQRLADLKIRLASIRPFTVPIMRELPAGRRRTTTIQYRGNFLDRGPPVTAAVPAAFPPLPDGAPHNRLGLAQWLVDERNPLTARVLVNRLWERLFGTGLVATSEDFGTQGDPPSHPELLDYLATELVARHWDLKSLVRLLVVSATYRQSSRAVGPLVELDPDNRLLARGPRFRLDAEAVRDQALAVGGLLSGKMYGPAVKPVQPSFGLSAAFGGDMDWQTSEGEDRYRRGIYTAWRRTNPYPSMAIFDAPSREVCTARRPRTNTPLQALVTLNDPVYVEAAQALARRIALRPGGTGGPAPREPGGSAAEKARYGFRLCLARQPADGEVARLVQLYGQARQRFSREPEQARRMATIPLGPPSPPADLADLAAWTAVANVLLNLDETLMPR
jgi:mono/diheme cytochrome c family protein